MKEALQAILDYAHAPNTDYALLINGPWGCGKTYFWKNVVVPALAASSRERRPKRFLYASFYGISDTRDIDRTLFAQSYPGIRKKSVGRVSRLLASGLNALGFVDLARIDLRSLVLAKDSIICFDDLERSELTMREILGCVNAFVEHEAAKAIVLCNEAAIRDEEYKTIKEKVIGASLNFEPDLDAVIKTLIHEYKPRTALYDFISKNVALLRHLFTRSETNNIRALRRAIAALAVVSEALLEGGVDPKKVAKQLIYAVAPAAFEIHGRSADPDKLRSILSQEYLITSGVRFDRKRDQNDEEKYAADFAEKYLSDVSLTHWRDAVGCLPICDFLLTGVLDRPALVEWAQDLTKPPDEKEDRINRLIYDASSMQDEEFSKTAAQVLREIETGQTAPIGRYFGLYKEFEWLSDSGLISSTRQDLLRQFRDGLRVALDSGSLKPEARLESAFSHPSFSAQKSDEGRELRQRVLEANADLLTRALSERTQVMACKLESDPSNFIDALIDTEESGFLYVPVFQELDANTVAQWILDLPNSLKIRLDAALHQRYEMRALGPEFSVELPVIKQVTASLEADVAAGTEPNPMPMSRFNVKRIAARLHGVVDQLEQLGTSEKVSGPPEDQAGREQGGK